MSAALPERTNIWITAAAGVAGFAIPVSTALLHAGAAALLVASLFPPYRQYWPGALRQPFVRCCLFLWMLALAGLSYTPDLQAGVDVLRQMHPLLLAPALFAVCHLAPVRQGIIAGFAIGALASLFASLASWAYGQPWMAGEADRLMNGLAVTEHYNWVVFRNHIFHTLFLAWLALGALAVLLVRRVVPRRTVIAVILIVITLFGLFYLVRGRTGQLIFLTLLPLLLWLWDKRRGMLVSVLVATIGLPLLWQSSDVLRERLQQAEHEARHVNGQQQPTSIGLRLIWYRDSLAAIADSPVIGHGTGSARTELTRRQGAGVHDSARTRNPHSSYLWLGVELGLIGVAGLLALFASSLVDARRFAAPQSWLIILITWSMILGNLVNSFIMDRPTGTGYILMMCALLAGPLRFPGVQRPGAESG